MERLKLGSIESTVTLPYQQMDMLDETGAVGFQFGCVNLAGLGSHSTTSWAASVSPMTSLASTMA